MDREAMAAKARQKRQRKHPTKPAPGVTQRVQGMVAATASAIGSAAVATAHAVKDMVSPA